MRLAAFSDIHGNKHALEAVLRNIESQAPDRIVCLGDLVGYGAFPNEVIRIVRDAGIPAITGNYDDGVANDRDDCGCAYTRSEDAARGQLSLRWTQRVVTPENKAWLRSLPRELRFDAADKHILCVHGSPRRINEYLYQDRPEQSLLRMLAPLRADILLCGHTHLPYHRRVGTVDLINSGSAGKPKDGDPRAVYALIEVGGEVTAVFPRLPYDVDAAARAIESADLPDEYAAALRTAAP